ncbi:hypothetical protein [uncultured Alistipes sp.]|uniref:hypothetical protein n=1 Tax=uncultured Alistipes sp. TaxID=538949 RepID=UPI002626BDD9|nr:hypothetical protein [uncultured Alistipes sp.]
MKTMKNFAAQQLSKKQMNDVKGGDSHIWCAVYLDGRVEMGIAATDTVADAERQLTQMYEGVYDNVRVICDERFD